MFSISRAYSILTIDVGHNQEACEATAHRGQLEEAYQSGRHNDCKNFANTICFAADALKS